MSFKNIFLESFYRSQIALPQWSFSNANISSCGKYIILPLDPSDLSILQFFGTINISGMLAHTTAWDRHLGR